ncbi:hypothetical protein Fcan01_27532 [Folsomia candida]|uniref:Uncharacterized protein n=1 Tax=Folsomia candida TaxID=158441 RepID=A0A226CY72_FOLCA|nr:hypothetical protein Fcan01_27532 [Folsomia candida]
MRKSIVGKRRIQQLARHETLNISSVQIDNSTKTSETKDIPYSESVAFLSELDIICNDHDGIGQDPEFNFNYWEVDSSDSESESGCDDEYDDLSELKMWATNTNVSQHQFTSLLKILKLHSCFNNFPSDCRSLVPVSKFSNVKSIEGGEYVHLGLKNAVLELNPCEGQILKLQVSVDGLPVYKSTNSSFWPILGYFADISCAPFVIGLFFGKQKPQNVNEYLREFVDEFIQVKAELSAVNISMHINCFVCDVPAKSLIKFSKGHAGYFG